MDTKIRIKHIANLVKNSANNQFSLNLRSMKLRELGITHHELLNFELPMKVQKKVTDQNLAS